MDFGLESLRLSNFRCFEQAEVELDPDVTVLIADNGHGKSATLDAIAICLGELLGSAQLKPRSRKTERVQLRPSDATSTYALPPYRSSDFPVSLAAKALLDEEAVEWAGSLTRSGTDPDWVVDDWLLQSISARLAEVDPVDDLPVFAYYGTNRTRASVRQTKLPDLGRADRALGYRNSLRAGDSLAELGPWLAQTEWEQTRRGESAWGSALDAVYGASRQVLRSHGVSQITYSLEERDLLLDFGRLSGEAGEVSEDLPGSSVMPMSLIADGYRSVLGLVADLAFRCVALNAHREGEAPQLTSGVVLIDEIDMHLHPVWQMHVLQDLQAAFPRVQFVVTTHSPFILSSVPSSAVRQIHQREFRSTFSLPAASDVGTRIDTLAEGLLRSPIRAPSELADHVRSLADALNQRDLDRATQISGELESNPSWAQDRDVVRLMSELRWRVQRESDSAED